MYPFGSGMPQPQPPSSLGGSPNANNRPAGLPFGAGWAQPPTVSGTSHAPYPNQPQQTPYPAQNASSYPNQMHFSGGGATYPHNQQNLPYPQPNSTPMYGQATNINPHPTTNNVNPYPQSNHASQYPSPNHGSPYPPSNNAVPYPQSNNASPYPPSTNTSSYPQSNNTSPYPPSTNTSPYPQSNNTSPYPPSSDTRPYPASNYNPYPPSQNTHTYPSNHGSQSNWGPGSSDTYGNTAHCFNEMTQRQSQIQLFTQKKEGTPIVFPVQNFDPVKDAHDLRKAMKGFGTDEDALINIICRRSNEQRQEIQRQYKTNFGKDLIDDIKSETSGNFEKLLVGLLLPIVDYYCAEINDAISGLGTDEDVLIEILCTLSNLEIHTIKTQYLRLYGAHLESELQSETSGNFKRLLVSLCNASRDESGHADPAAAQYDAKELLRAGELRAGTDESMFNMILCHRNYQQLKLIFQEYERITGHSLEKAVKKEFSGDIMDGLIAIYKCVTNKSEFFASRLHKSMAGIGTNDKQLIRVIITRSEIDLADIKATFERMYGKSLKSWIKGDTSGHYKHALYALIGEQRSS